MINEKLSLDGTRDFPLSHQPNLEATPQAEWKATEAVAFGAGICTQLGREAPR
jgi:hypothetical protein